MPNHVKPHRLKLHHLCLVFGRFRSCLFKCVLVWRSSAPLTIEIRCIKSTLWRNLHTRRLLHLFDFFYRVCKWQCHTRAHYFMPNIKTTRAQRFNDGAENNSIERNMTQSTAVNLCWFLWFWFLWLNFFNWQNTAWIWDMKIEITLVIGTIHIAK